MAAFSSTAFSTSAFSSSAFSFDDGTSPVVADTQSGGWEFFLRYQDERDRRRRKRLEIDEAEEATQSLPPVEAEIAQFLHRQERHDERRAEIDRLRALVREHSASELPQSVATAFDKAATRQTIRSLRQLDIELKRMMEDEEFMVLLMMLED